MSVRDRIKFMEQMAKKEEGAADERGRSPGGVSSVRSNASDSPRPLSKVRTSFVAIEKDGRVGLQRQPSADSNLSAQRFSADPERASSILQDHTRTNVSSPETTRSELQRGPGSSALSASPSSIKDATAAAASQPTAPPSSFRPVLPGAATSGLATADPITSQPRAEPTPPNATATTQGLAAASGPTGTAGPSAPARQEGVLAAPAQIRQAPRGESAKDASVVHSGQAAKEVEVQAVPNQAQGKGLESKSKLNGHTNGPNGTSGEGATDAPAVNGADKAKTSKPAASVKPPPRSSSQPRPADKAPASTPKKAITPPPEKPAVEKKTPNTASPAFVKPRPKSPTRPVKLPASLTTHTAASGQKSKNAKDILPPARPQSRTNGKALGRSASVASRQRPSIGPPPKQTAKDHPVPKKEIRAPDESFLARMMRPTQASASKVAEKVQLPTTPPRKTATTAKKPPSARPGPPKRTVSKTMSATSSAAGTPETKKKEESSSVKAVPKRAEGNVPLTISEETIGAPKRSVQENGFKPSTETSKTTEKGEEAPGAPKASDALFAAFMNPGSEAQQPAVAPQTQPEEQEEW